MRVVGNQHFRILGSGSYLPKHVVSAEEMGRGRRCPSVGDICRLFPGRHALPLLEAFSGNYTITNNESIGCALTERRFLLASGKNDWR